MNVRIKDGVRVKGLSNEILLAIIIAQTIYSDTERDMTITSLTDGDHMAGSLHHCGDAFDLRLPVNSAHTVMCSRLRDALGSSYDVVLEKDHIHVEYDPG